MDGEMKINPTLVSTDTYNVVADPAIVGRSACNNIGILFPGTHPKSVSACRLLLLFPNSLTPEAGQAAKVLRSEAKAVRTED